MDSAKARLCSKFKVIQIGLIIILELNPYQTDSISDHLQPTILCHEFGQV